MGKFFSIGGMAPTGGEGNQGGGRFARQGEHVPQELLERRHPDFFRTRPDAPEQFSAPGDVFTINGDVAEVMHEDRNNDGSTDVTVRRSVRGNSGTYKVHTEPAKGRRRVVTETKRTFE